MRSVTLKTWHSASREPERLSGAAKESPRIVLDADEWAGESVHLLDFDRRVHTAEDELRAGFAIELRGEAANVARMREQFPLRYQRLFTRRNERSNDARFDRVLAAHAALHDRTKPLVRADHDHALDVWQWTLRLAPGADETLQIAALFHDVERLTSEADVRIEQHAPDYLAFKAAHAKRGAAQMAALLGELGVPRSVSERAEALVEKHEQPEHDADLNTLNDADALSWFALNSPGFLAYFGPEHTEKKVRYSLARVRSPRAKELLFRVRLEPAIASMLAAAERESAQA